MKIKQTTQFVDNSISVRTVIPFERKTITSVNLLVYMMKAQTEAFPDKQALALALNNAYGLRSSFRVSAYGRQIVFECRFQYIRSQWIQSRDYLKEVITIMDQIMNHSVFNEESLQEAKYLYRTRIIQQMDDPAAYSVTQAMEIIDLPHNIRLRVQGYPEDLDRITLQDMEQLDALVKSLPHHVYVVGQPEPPVLQYLGSIDSDAELQADYEAVCSDRFFTKTQQRDIAQTNMTLVYQDQITADTPLYFPMIITNAVLGAGPNSLLFEEIREKRSYCYSVHSTMIRFDGAVVIHLGTRKKYIQDVLSLVEEQIRRISEQDYEDRLLEVSKSDYIDGIITAQDHPFSITEQMFLDELLHRQQTLSDRIEKIRNVTKADVSTCAKHMKLLSAFYLEEETDEE
ncbi:M16 family metallopeptidase [Catenisphaera adipataccumulans]|uniref:Putative Zn-dependent peptidase n=1 Tax=Catenisphaera adipataccumulans TaxID=700500 RepID=A0A7W8FY89_9FIRM|nr:insulinase family protein [Catenisphaera adipataccumulans]MBB5183757.1 putative Zn-dependent peptidase [Catenisphaera adipataccumulans]